MVKKNEHGRWYVEGTRKFWARKEQAERYEKVVGFSAPLSEEVEPEPKKRWWSK